MKTHIPEPKELDELFDSCIEEARKHPYDEDTYTTTLSIEGNEVDLVNLKKLKAHINTMLTSARREELNKVLSWAWPVFRDEKAKKLSKSEAQDFRTKMIERLNALQSRSSDE